IRHVSIEKNQVVDCLVKLLLNKKDDLQVFDSMPWEVLDLMHFDIVDGISDQLI
ncbi:hypothetical protein Goklo_024313, partial [Gossypium klotzschianum]|nr:hypothetical protein [Gossypium klotzschianum]